MSILAMYENLFFAAMTVLHLALLGMVLFMVAKLKKFAQKIQEDEGARIFSEQCQNRSLQLCHDRLRDLESKAANFDSRISVFEPSLIHLMVESKQKKTKKRK